MQISLCMIVKDEEATLGNCLESVASVVDEIIIVDTGSSDSSKEIASKYTDKVYDFEWIDDFSAARNYAFSLATKEMLMWLDADDVLPEESAVKLKTLKDELPKDVCVVYMPYDIAFDESGNPTFTYFRERLVRRSAHPVWIEPVHEVIAVQGKSMYSDISVRHHKVKTNPPERNLRIMEKQLASGNELSPRLKFYYARELMYSGKTERAIEAFEHFLSDSGGWAENKLCACIDVSVCYELAGDSEKALESALRGLSFGLPRSKNLCRIGELFLKNGKLAEAEYWYTAALNCPHNLNLGFNEKDFDGFIPAIQLCVIYDRLGESEKAEQYNEIAGGFKPDSPAFLYNRQYFQTKK